MRVQQKLYRILCLTCGVVRIMVLDDSEKYQCPCGGWMNSVEVEGYLVVSEEQEVKQ